MKKYLTKNMNNALKKDELKDKSPFYVFIESIKITNKGAISQIPNSSYFSEPFSIVCQSHPTT